MSSESTHGESISFGRMATVAESTGRLLDLEAEHDRLERFTALDALLGHLLVRALQGKQPLKVVERDGVTALTIKDIKPEEQEMIEEWFSLGSQRSRGAWWLPEEAVANVGTVHFAASLRKHGRFAHNITLENRYKLASDASPEGVFAHTVLNPLFFTLYEPFSLRGNQAGKQKEETFVARWKEVEKFLADLGFEVEEELSAMRYGSGWSRLSAGARLEAKKQLSKALANQAVVATGARYRARRILALAERYYSKANETGFALRKKVLTRELELVMSGFFGGAWLGFLDYLGEAPHPEEQVTTTLPETKLLIKPSEKAKEKVTVGAPDLKEIDEKQLELIIASLYGGQRSPVEKRLEVLKGFWEVFDNLHASQESGMRSLWGLVEYYRHLYLDHLSSPPDGERFGTFQRPDPHQRGLYRELLSEELRREIEECWGTMMLVRYPDRIVTEPYPYVRMAEVLGPALKFWEGASLTAWFLCEGPYSRTTMHELARYHERELTGMAAAGTPVDESVFEELREAQRRLGRKKPVWENVRETETVSGIVIETSMSSGYRRTGFERLRDTVTRCRRSWAKAHLENYLRSRSEGEIRDVATAYHVATQQRGGKSPTPKQFARTAESATNQWFGGNMALLYRAFGEKPPLQAERVRLVPDDIESFAADVYWALGGTQLEATSWEAPEFEREAHRQRERRERDRSDLAGRAIEYLQRQEALGKPPTLKEFGRDTFEYRAKSALGANLDQAWAQYVRAIEDSARLATY